MAEAGLSPGWTIALSVVGSGVATALVNALSGGLGRWADARRESAARRRKNLQAVKTHLADLATLLAARPTHPVVDGDLLRYANHLEEVRYDIDDAKLSQHLGEIASAARLGIWPVETREEALERDAMLDELEPLVESARKRVAQRMD